MIKYVPNLKLLRLHLMDRTLLIAYTPSASNFTQTYSYSHSSLCSLNDLQASKHRVTCIRKKYKRILCLKTSGADLFGCFRASVAVCSFRIRHYTLRISLNSSIGATINLFSSLNWDCAKLQRPRCQYTVNQFVRRTE